MAAAVGVLCQVFLAACLGSLTNRVSWIDWACLSPDFALARRQPVAGWCGQQVGNAAAGSKIKVGPRRANSVVHETREAHRECADAVGPTALRIE